MGHEELFDGSTDFQAPLSLEGLMAIPNKRGVFLLEDASGRPILLATAAAIRTRMRSRLTAPEDNQPSRQADLRQIARRLAWKLCGSPFETDWQYWALARAIYPQRYRELLGFAPAWFMHVNLSDKLPALRRTQNLSAAGECLGPFPSGKAASRFVDALADACGLCRHENILRQAPHGRGCVYRQMGRCHGACEGAITMEAYRLIVAQACQAAGGQRQAIREELSSQMRQLAGQRKFEQAAIVKGRLAHLAELDGGDYIHVRSLGQFRYLLFQRALSAKKVRSFLVEPGSIAAGPELAWPVTPEQAQAVLAAFRGLAEPPLPPDPVGREAISLVSQYFFSAPEKRGLVVHYHDALAAAELAELIQQNQESLKHRPARAAPPADEAGEGGV
jgi:excinuclease UvrABC nuclease subunit